MDQEPGKTGKILLYNNGGEKEFVSVVFQDETFWLTQKAMAELFDVKTPAISKHLQNIYEEEELDRGATISKMETVQDEGGRSVRRTIDFYNPTRGLTAWKGAPDGKILKSDVLIAKNYLNEKELSRLNRLVTMFIDYAELMAEDEQLMSMKDWLAETDRFLTNNRRKVLGDKGRISRDEAVKKVSDIYADFRKKQDKDYISEFDRQTAKYLRGEADD